MIVQGAERGGGAWVVVGGVGGGAGYEKGAAVELYGCYL
jgi:hypothetical protein